MNEFLRGVQLEDLAEPEVSSFRFVTSSLLIKTTSFLLSSLLSHEPACRFDVSSCKIYLYEMRPQLPKFGVGFFDGKWIDYTLFT